MKISIQDRFSEKINKLTHETYFELIHKIDPNLAVNMNREDFYKEAYKFVEKDLKQRKSETTLYDIQFVTENIVSDIIGFGPLDYLIEDDRITEILVNDPQSVYIEINGKLQKTSISFRDKDHILRIAQRISTRIGRRIDERSPMVDARLPDGSRVNIIIPPVSLNGPVISIRKFSKSLLPLAHMIEDGSMDERMAEFLQLAIKARLNILISGGTGSGKTTLLNTLSNYIDPVQRVVTIEDAAELKLNLPDLVRLEARPSNIEGQGEISIRDLLRNSLRMRPDRIIVGEVRGIEAVDMLQAMNTGHDGSLSTIHANSATDSLYRLENMYLMDPNQSSLQVIYGQIVGGIDLIVHLERMRDGRRRLTEIVEVADNNRNTPKTNTLFEFIVKGQDENRNIVGNFHFHPPKNRPKYIKKLEHFDLLNAYQTLGNVS